jgi:polyhydroxyalkanoate synthesis regulator phasin
MSGKKSSKKKVGKKAEGIIDNITKLVRTSVFAGLGLAFLGEETVEGWARKIARENKLSTKDVQSFVRDVRRQSRDARKDVEKSVKSLIDDIVPGAKKKSGGSKKKPSRKR